MRHPAAVPPAELHQRADALAKELRLLDAAVQQANWLVELA